MGEQVELGRVERVKLREVWQDLCFGGGSFPGYVRVGLGPSDWEPRFLQIVWSRVVV